MRSGLPASEQRLHRHPGVPSIATTLHPAPGCSPQSQAASPDDQEGGRADRFSGARHRCMERKKIFRSVRFWVVIVVLVALTFSTLFTGKGGFQQVSTSTALAQFHDGNVTSATINDKEQTLDLELKKPVEGSEKVTASYPLGASTEIFGIVSGTQADGTSSDSKGVRFDTNVTQ